MNKIEQYKAAKQEANESAKWAALIGDRYYGGGGGVGRLHKFSIAGGEASPTVYHQYSDGATNYHPMPAALRPHLEAAIKAAFPSLLADALARHEEAVKAFAAEAVKEHAELLEAAGLST
jgi:hypothetical protein